MSHRGAVLGSVRLGLPGRHNALNARATIAVALEFDVPFEQTATALENFPGIERRFESKGEVSGVHVVDDYGHHPAEIVATLAAARGLHRGRIVVAFQPHRYTRTRDLWDEFATAFNDADLVFVTEIFAAGEGKLPGVEAAPLVDAVRAHGHRKTNLGIECWCTTQHMKPTWPSVIWNGTQAARRFVIHWSIPFSTTLAMDPI